MIAFIASKYIKGCFYRNNQRGVAADQKTNFGRRDLASMKAALDRAGAAAALTERIVVQQAGSRRVRHVGRRPTWPIAFFRKLESCRSPASAEGTDVHVTCVSSPVIQSWYELTFWMAGSQ